MTGSIGALSGQHARGTDAGVRLWLFALSGLVALMVIAGGATRLTGSGLSITEWQPIVGTIPPLSDSDWQVAFAKYRETSQYARLNRGMGLDDFKFIFWWEWAHRFLGRLIGLAFALPFLYFLARGVISRALMPKLLAIFALGGLQGAVGWYMVQSGLADRIDVSPYRLALHLGVAFLILGAILWVALSLGAEERKSVRCLTLTPPQRRVAGILVVLVFLQILLGGLVAGTKAGLAYNTWPLMDGRLVPPGLAILSPWYLNLFENVLTVQFNHRLLAYLVAAVALWHAASVARTAVDEPVRWAALALAIAVLAQIALGIWTLLAVVPLSLGLAHQAGAVAVFTLAVWHLHRVTHT